MHTNVYNFNYSKHYYLAMFLFLGCLYIHCICPNEVEMTFMLLISRVGAVEIIRSGGVWEASKKPQIASYLVFFFPYLRVGEP